MGPSRNIRYWYFWGPKMLSAGEYRFRLVSLWAYAVLWVLGVFGYCIYFDGLPPAVRIVGGILLFLFGPPWTDMFGSYARYQATWADE